MNKKQVFAETFWSIMGLLLLIYVVIAAALWTLTDLGAALLVVGVAIVSASISGAAAAWTWRQDR